MKCVCLCAFEQTSVFYLCLCTCLCGSPLLRRHFTHPGLNYTQETKGFIFVLACQGLLVLLNVPPPLSAYHSLCSLISFLSLLNGFLSLSSHHKCSLSPLLFFNTYKTEKARPGPGHLEAPVKLSPRPGSLPLASCSIVSGPSQLIPCIAIVAGHCLQPPPTPPG